VTAPETTGAGLASAPAADRSTTTPPLPRSIEGALLRYRILAYVVGVGLVVLVLIGVPLQTAGHNDSVVKIVGPLHGFLYMVYLVLVLDLARRCRWNPIRMILVMAAGTVPFLSFVAEHYTTRAVREGRTGWHGFKRQR
jgi:integral membrane protein